MNISLIPKSACPVTGEATWTASIRRPGRREHTSVEAATPEQALRVLVDAVESTDKPVPSGHADGPTPIPVGDAAAIGHARGYDEVVVVARAAVAVDGGSDLDWCTTWGSTPEHADAAAAAAGNALRMWRGEPGGMERMARRGADAGAQRDHGGAD